jgi:hypothetical protein
MLDSRIYEPRGLQLVFGEVPLATVPYIATRQELMRHRMRVGAAVIGSLGVIAAGLLIVHTAIMPLDVLLAAFINRMNL